MSENSEQQAQKPDDTPEYLKFLGLLVVMLVVILSLAFLSPRLISQVTPAVLGLGGAPDAQPAQAVEEGPAVEEAPLGEPVAPLPPKEVVEPEGAVVSEGDAAPAVGQGGLETAEEGVRHEVLPGQTLYQVAELYGLSVQEIAAANNLVNPAQLEPGTILIIPQSP